MQTLFTPWRLAYVSVKQPSGDCFFCEAARHPADPERLVVHRGRHHLVMLNRHPYTNGHLMVAPLAHLASPLSCGPEQRAELWPLVLRCQEVLDAAYHPDGFNLGLNLGRAAGAGVPDHFHFHVVPRWRGDTNFMSVVGGVRVVPESPGQIAVRLRPLFAGDGAEA